VTQGGGWGNVIGAVSEAAFMTGLERNGDVVTMAAYVRRGWERGVGFLLFPFWG